MIRGIKKTESCFQAKKAAAVPSPIFYVAITNFLLLLPLG